MTYFTKYLESHLPDMASFGLKVVICILIFIIGSKLIKVILKLLRKSMERANVDTGVIQFLSSLGKILLYAVLIFNIGTQFGVTEASVAALLGSAGLTVGLGLQGGLSNLSGGVMILLFKPFLVGDYIIENSHNCEGTVVKIDMFYTTLSTVDNKRIVIPNGNLSNNSITNVTAKDKRRLEIKVGISYESSVKQAKEILERLLQEDSSICSEEEVVVFVDELAASSVVVGLRAWVATDEYWPTKWRLNEKIKEAFDNQGIKIPYPQMEVHMNRE